MYYTASLHYTLYYKDERSVNQKAAQQKDLREKQNGGFHGQYSSGHDNSGVRVFEIFKDSSLPIKEQVRQSVRKS